MKNQLTEKQKQTVGDVLGKIHLLRHTMHAGEVKLVARCGSGRNFWGHLLPGEKVTCKKCLRYLS